MKNILIALETFEKARNWDSYNHISSDKERLEQLRNTSFNLMGELGELANCIKKCLRDGTYNEENIKEEISDIFTFLLKLSKIANMDMEEEFYKKLQHNEERFERFVVEKK